MSDSKQGIKIRGSNDKSPAVLSTAPSGTEDGLAVWVVNPSGGGGAADQGKKGSAPESWYVQDGSGLLATAAKQDTGNASLASIDTKLSAFSSGTSTVSSVNCASAANLFASNSSAKSRWIYNPVGNGTLWVRLGSGSHTGVSTSTFFVEGGQFVRVYPLDFTGQVQGLLAAGSQTIQATEVA